MINIQESNLLIRNFMEVSPMVYGDWNLSSSFNNGLYDKSWDWLMPVVEKIENIEHPTRGNEFQVVIYEEEVEIFQKSDEGMKEIVYIPVDGESKLTNTHKAVVEFIKWYNNK